MTLIEIKRSNAKYFCVICEKKQPENSLVCRWAYCDQVILHVCCICSEYQVADNQSFLWPELQHNLGVNLQPTKIIAFFKGVADARELSVTIPVRRFFVKEVEGGFTGTMAEPWGEGKVIVGFFQKAETLEGCESRKITLSQASPKGGDPEVACWETAALARFSQKFKVGSCYLIHCMGKQKFKNGRGWAFKVYELESEKEMLDAFKKYGDGKTLCAPGDAVLAPF